VKEDDEYADRVCQQLADRGFVISSTLQIAQMHIRDQRAFHRKMVRNSDVYVPIVSQNTERPGSNLRQMWEQEMLDIAKRRISNYEKIAGVIVGGLTKPRNIPYYFLDKLYVMEGLDVPSEFLEKVEKIRGYR
jgi:hypothetical protein